MAQAATSQPPHGAVEDDRAVYDGLSWSQVQGRSALWKAASRTTPITYAVEEIDDGQWCARQGYPDSPGRPNIEIGRFAQLEIAMTACERHDFRFWSSVAERAGVTCVFMGSPDAVSSFVQALPDYEREDLLDMIAGGYALPDGRNFSESASYFPSVKTGLKQEKSGDYTATLSVKALDLPLWLMQARPGTPLAVGVVGLAPEEDGWEERVQHALRRSYLLVQDNGFHAWLSGKYDRWGLIATAMTQTSEEVERAVEETLRRLIGCPSRRDLATNRDAVCRLEKIDREYYYDLSRGFTEIISAG